MGIGKRIVWMAGMLCLLAPAGVHAQDRPRIWVAAGPGSAVTQDEEGLAFLAQVVYQKRAHQATLRGLALLGDPFGGSSDGGGELGVLYGRAWLGRAGHASANAGLSFVGLGSCAGTDDDSCFTIGVPVTLEVSLKPIPTFGAGLQLYGNINPKASWLGVAVFLQLGWMP